MDDEDGYIGVYSNGRTGELRLECDQAGFEILRNLVCEKAAFAEIVQDVQLNQIQTILIESPTEVQPEPISVQLMWIAIVVVASFLLFVLGVGLVTVAKWLTR